MSDLIDMGQRLEAFYGGVAETAMRGMPMVNPKLSVKVIGIQQWQNEWLCVLITPWFMNLVLLPNSVEATQVGTKSRVALPGGMIEFIQSDGAGIGPHRMCSLFSPVFEFETMEDAELTAAAVLEQLLEAPAPDDDADDGMVAIWEGRLEQAEAQAAALQSKPEPDETPAAADPKLSRRALFGLSPKPDAAEAVT